MLFGFVFASLLGCAVAWLLFGCLFGHVPLERDPHGFGLYPVSEF